LKILFFLLIACAAFAQQNIEIKSLRAYSFDETAIPIVTDNSNLKIEFDIQASFQPSLNIVFRFCDKNWNPTSNIFLNNYGNNIAYTLDFLTLPATVQEARYRFFGNFPNNHDFVEFPFSGKWRYYITDSQDSSIVYGEGRFYVIYNDVEVSASIKRGLLEDRVYNPLALGRIYALTAAFNLPDDFFPGFVSHAEIIENHKMAYPVIIDRTFNTTYRQFYWDGNRAMRFAARDIRPGNNYRQVNLMNINIYNSKNVPADFHNKIELSRFFKEGKRDLRGGSTLMNYRNEFATYLNVTFSIRPPDEHFGDIFLTGAFNNWELLPEYRMENRGGIYTKTVSLKRGVYDYQYVAASVTGGKITNDDWIILEGNFWETSNNYYIFIYYNDPNYGGYDRIIGYVQINSEGK
jgi:hypothetical protein